MKVDQAKALADALGSVLGELENDADRGPRSFAYPNLGAPLVSGHRDDAGRETVTLHV
jgi:hypothetical protein